MTLTATITEHTNSSGTVVIDSENCTLDNAQINCSLNVNASVTHERNRLLRRQH
jgi:hypothetical protein